MEPAVHSGERSVAYPELFGRAARVARGYDSLGVAAGDSVALLLRNDIAFLEASLGCAVLGATPVPINWHWQGGGRAGRVALGPGGADRVVPLTEAAQPARRQGQVPAGQHRVEQDARLRAG